MDGGPSFASRRPAATGLPAFSLPPPEIPRVANDGLSPLSSGAHTGSSMGSQPGTTAGSSGANYSYMSGSWPTPQPPSGGSSYSYAGAGNANPGASPLLSQPFPNARSLYQQVSPSAPTFPHSSGRHILSPAVPDGLPPPAPYHQASPVFLTPISGIGGAGNGGSNGSHQISHSQGHSQNQTTPTSSGPPPEGSFRAHHQQQHQHHRQQQHQHQQESSQQQHGPQYPYRPTSQQSSFPTFASNNSQQPQPSTTARTPPSADIVSASNAVSRAMSISGPGPMSAMAPPVGYASGRQSMSFGYQMSGSAGPIMSNMHQPGMPMVAVGHVSNIMPGSYNPGPSPHPHSLHVYGQSHPHQTPQDRPFKCDQCIQSFNRNHDLKRHKKIHLAVKPFPCTFCEKAFSRKDALKRHRLVKGCGGGRAKEGESNDSPPDRSDIMSDTTEGSPKAPKKEPI